MVAMAASHCASSSSAFLGLPLGKGGRRFGNDSCAFVANAKPAPVSAARSTRRLLGGSSRNRRRSRKATKSSSAAVLAPDEPSGGHERRRRRTRGWWRWTT
ncbi:hypothetical protein PR202_gb06172 [Eleusine coracana subsp. coracana]|uniref:Uncharacterized protein n=1 Tax=Eleusine coracana subsp. coracana TaxID=191504 RepID=A0AAV5E8R8_ELECO|nr:hypothetical protein PR202_gb06172 [Eleusine coracana subsp. coracana]